MSDHFWLCEEQLRRIKSHFPLSHGVPRVDDRKVVSGIIHVIRNGLRWRDAPEIYGPHKTLYNRFIRWSKMGVFDQITQRYHGAKEGWVVWIRKINKCALEMKFTGHDLADLINSHYQDLENWQHSANVALQEGLVKVCKTKK